jgi:hypothetical protein
MNAYEICSEVYGLSGFGIPSAFQNGDIDDRLIFFLLRRVARDLAKYRWNELVRTHYINIQQGKADYDMPTDFREMIPGSWRTMEDLRPIDFPSNFETWAQIDAKVGITGVQHRMRFQEGKLRTLPSDTDYQIRFEYISNHPVVTAPDADTPDKRIETFANDSDIWLLDDDLIIKALKAKWSIEKGLDTLQADMADSAGYLQELKGTQAGSQRIQLGGKSPYTPQAPYTNLWK